MATTAERRNIAPQKNRIGTNDAHAIRRYYGPGYERWALAVEMVKPETVDRERAARNFRRNIRQREDRQTREMLTRDGQLTARRVERKKNRLRMGNRIAAGPRQRFYTRLRAQMFDRLLGKTYDRIHTDMHENSIEHTPVA